MRKKEAGKRVLAWMLTAVMVVGSSSFAAADEEISDLSAQEETVMAETELSGEETDVPYTDMETPAAEPDIFMPSDEELPEEEQDALIVTDEQDQAGEAQPESEMTGTELGMEDADGTVVGEDQGLISVEDVEVVEHGLEDEGAAVVTSESAGDPVPETVDGVFKDGGSYEVTLESEGDCKWYTFTPQEDGAYVVYSGESEGDPYIDVYTRDAEGNLVYFADDDDSAGNLDFRLRLSLRAATTYFFKLTSLGSSDFYRVCFNSVPALKSISLQDTEKPILVSGLCYTSDLYGRVKATLTYEGEETTEIYGENSDKYGTVPSYSVLNEDDELSPGLHMVTASALGCSASVQIPVLSMSEAAAQNVLELDQDLPMKSPNHESRVFAGFTPQESGEYIFSTDKNAEINIYDVESENLISNYCTAGCRASLTTGKVYLVTVLLLTDYEGDITLSVRTAKKIASISLLNENIDCNVLTVGEKLMGITVSVNYEDETTASAPSLGDWTERETDSGIWYYSCRSSEGDWIELTMWDQDQQIDMPTFGRDIVTGTYTLKASCGDKVSQGITFKINPVSISADLTLNESSSVDSDEEGNAYFTFTPDKTGLYKFTRTDGVEDEGKIIVYDGKNAEIDYRFYSSEENWECFCTLKAGERYTYRVDVGSPGSSVNVSIKKMEIALSVEDTADRSFPEGYVSICDDVSISFDDGEPRYYDLENDSAVGFYYGSTYYYLRTHLYAVDASGNLDYNEQIGTNSDGEYELKRGVYARVIELGIYDENDNFVGLSDVEPIIMKIIVQCATHTYETVTVKAATCAAAGSAKKRCTVCGYEDPTLVSIPPTGKHTGGKATCTKKAVCSVCGQEYGALAAHSFGAWKKTSEATVFKKAVQTRSCSVCGKQETQEVGSTAAKIIKLNAGSLKMKVKQKTTKLTVTMGPGDSISSVKSSNTKVLKATVKSGKITLTAQKKAGKANLTIKLASGASKTIKVTVQKKAVTTTSIKGVSKKLTLKKKKKATLKPQLNPITSQDKIKYSSSNKKVATVSSNGVVTAKKAGKAIITIKAGKKSFKCTITVK